MRETLGPSLDSFLGSLGSNPTVSATVEHPSIQLQAPTPRPSPAPTQTPTPPGTQTPTQTLTLEHTRLSELLLQSLLRLDAISTDGSWDLARAERKGAVREVQGLLDRLDGEWGKVKGAGGHS